MASSNTNPGFIGPVELPEHGNTGNPFGAIYGPSGQAQFPEEPEEPVSPEEESTGVQYRTLTLMPNINLGNIGVDHDQYQPTTREVSKDELVENRLTNLLNSDSEYIRQARRAGERAAAQRGALSSSIFAGSSQSAAIQSALPIAQQDAETYYRTAAENMSAKNNMTLAKLQSATSIAQSRIGASATLGAASISANAQLRLKEMDSELRKDLFKLGADHDAFMENLRQGHRIELEELGFNNRKILTEMGFEHDFALADLSHQQRIEIEEMFSDPRFYAQLDFQKQNAFSNLMLGITGMYANGIMSMNLADIDAQAFQRGENFFSRMYQFMFDFNTQLWLDDGIPDIGDTGPEEGGS